MKTYNKPIAELENFNLDSEFASGACSVIPDHVAETYKDVINGNMDVAREEIEFYQETGIEAQGLLALMDTFYTDLSYADIANSGESELLDLVKVYTIYEINTSQDDPNSGFCYFTFASGAGKAFS